MLFNQAMAQEDESALALIELQDQKQKTQNIIESNQLFIRLNTQRIDDLKQELERLETLRANQYETVSIQSTKLAEIESQIAIHTSYLTGITNPDEQEHILP